VYVLVVFEVKEGWGYSSSRKKYQSSGCAVDLVWKFGIGMFLLNAERSQAGRPEGLGAEPVQTADVRA
jgi:hypothetical protein